MANNNFRWLINDIDSSLVLKVIYSNETEEEYAIYNILDIVDVTGERLKIETANIDDLTNFLTMGVIRFVNVIDKCDILDIPFRNFYKLYENGNRLGDGTNKLIPFSSLEIFSIIDEQVDNDYYILSVLISDISDDLREIMDVSFKFGNSNMQDRFDMMTKITMINHRRLVSD